MTIKNAPQYKYFNTRNKIIMDYIVEYINKNNRSKNNIALFNHMRLYKQMILPCDLIGNKETNRFRKEIATSCLKWKIAFPTMPKPLKKIKELWNNFIKCLKNKAVMTIFNSSKMHMSKKQISNERKYLK